MNCKIKCHYNTDVQVYAKHGKGNQIILDLTDQETRRKLRKAIKHYKYGGFKRTSNDQDMKDPLYARTIKVSINSKTKYYKGDEQVILSKLIGHEVTAKFQLKKYTFISTKKENKGETIKGIRATLIELKSDF